MGPRAGLDAVAKRKNSYHCPCREFDPEGPARRIITMAGLHRPLKAYNYVCITLIFCMYLYESS